MEAQVRKILAIEWALFKLSATADLQVPFNLSVQFLNDILWYLLQIVLFESLYSNVSYLGSWGIAEMRVFLGMLFLVDAFQMILFAHNFDVFSEKIIRKDLDLILLRPASAQQLMTCQRLQCGYILNAFFAFCWLMWSLSLLPGGFSWSRFLLVFIVVPCGLAVFYSSRLIVNTFALLITKAEYFQDLYFTFFRMGQRPDRLYSPGVRYLILMIIPVALIASVPARVLVDEEGSYILPFLILAAGVCLGVSHVFWRWAVKRYMMMG